MNNVDRNSPPSSVPEIAIAQQPGDVDVFKAADTSDVGDEALGVLETTPVEQPKIKLHNLRYAVVGDDHIENGERDVMQSGRTGGSQVERRVRLVDEVLRHDLGLTWDSMSLRNPDASRAIKLFKEIVDDGSAPDVDVIFVHSSVQKEFVDAFEQWLAENPNAMQKYGNVKIILYGENVSSELPRIIGSIALPTRKHVPFGVAVAGILANKGIVELPQQYADIPLKIRADEFNRQAHELLELAFAEKPGVKIWDNQDLLNSLHGLVNKFRAEQNLKPVELKTEGPHYFVWLVSQFFIHRKSAYIPAEALFNQNTAAQ